MTRDYEIIIVAATRRATTGIYASGAPFDHPARHGTGGDGAPAWESRTTWHEKISGWLRADGTAGARLRAEISAEVTGVATDGAVHRVSTTEMN
jgi:hypothetical protein